MRSGVLAKTRPALLRNRRIVFRGLEVGPALNQRNRYRQRHQKSWKRHQMGTKIDAKSIRNRVRDADAFWEAFGGGGGGQTCQTKVSLFGIPVLGSFSRKIEKIVFEKASKNQCKIMLEFEAKGLLKTKPKCDRKSRIFLKIIQIGWFCENIVLL